MKKLDSKRIRILVRAPNWIGDAVMSTPFFFNLRKIQSNAVIDILVSDWVADVFKGNPNIDNIIKFNKKLYKGFLELIKFGLSLRKNRYDIAYIIPDSFSSAFVMWAAGIKERIGYVSDYRSILLTGKLQRSASNIHRVEKYIDMLKTNIPGSSIKKTELKLYLDKKELNRANKFLGRVKGKIKIGINPTSKAVSRRWFPERYRELIKKLLNNFNIGVLIFGGADDRDYIKNVIKGIKTKSRILNLAGSSDLRTSMAIISKLKLFITNESGLMHIASVFNIPLIVINGAADIKETGPYNKGRKLIAQKDIFCHPCVKNYCPQGNLECLEKITVNEVFRDCKKMLRLIHSL